MNRRGAFAVVVALIAIACFGFERALFAQAARTKPKTKAASKGSSAPSNGKPTASDGKSVIEKQISNGRFRVIRIVKTNGAENPAFQIYRLYYALDVKCLVSDPRVGVPVLLSLDTTHAVPCKSEGEVHTGNGQLDFYKTENGWLPSKGPFYINWFDLVSTAPRTMQQQKQDSPSMTDANCVMQPNGMLLCPVHEGSKVSVRPNPPVSTEYDRFLGVWEYSTNQYIRVAKDQSGRFQFIHGYQWNDNGTWKTVWLTNTWLKNSDGIYLKPLNGKLDGRFVSGNFTPTHGVDFSYRIVLQFQPSGKLLYLVYMSGRLVDKYSATKLS